jgi:putative transposase
MDKRHSLSHTVWDCKDHVAWLPECRRKILHGQLRKNLGQVIGELSGRRESNLLEGHLMPDPVQSQAWVTTSR